MMLVDADAIEAELVGVGEGIEIFSVQVRPAGGIKECIGDPDPGGIVRGVEIVGQVRPGHEMEEEELHGRPASVRKNPSGRLQRLL